MAIGSGDAMVGDVKDAQQKEELWFSGLKSVDASEVSP
jgi:hypothetical protein